MCTLQINSTHKLMYCTEKKNSTVNSSLRTEKIQLWQQQQFLHHNTVLIIIAAMWSEHLNFDALGKSANKRISREKIKEMLANKRLTG